MTAVAFDAGIATLLATTVLIVSPGAAVTGMVVLAILAACAAVLVLRRRSRVRRARHPRRSPRHR